MVNGRLWTEDELAQLREMYQSGVLLKDIAVRLERGTSAVAAKVRAIGLSRYQVAETSDGQPEKPEPKPLPVRNFNVIEIRQIGRYFARGHTVADVYRQMRAKEHDILRVKSIAQRTVARL